MDYKIIIITVILCLLLFLIYYEVQALGNCIDDLQQECQTANNKLLDKINTNMTVCISKIKHISEDNLQQLKRIHLLNQQAIKNINSFTEFDDSDNDPDAHMLSENMIKKHIITSGQEKKESKVESNLYMSETSAPRTTELEKEGHELEKILNISLINHGEENHKLKGNETSESSPLTENLNDLCSSSQSNDGNENPIIIDGGINMNDLERYFELNGVGNDFTDSDFIIQGVTIQPLFSMTNMNSKTLQEMIVDSDSFDKFKSNVQIEVMSESNISCNSNKSNKSNNSNKSNKSNNSNKSNKSSKSNNSNKSNKSNKSSKSNKSFKIENEINKNIVDECVVRKEEMISTTKIEEPTIIDSGITNENITHIDDDYKSLYDTISIKSKNIKPKKNNVETLTSLKVKDVYTMSELREIAKNLSISVTIKDGSKWKPLNKNDLYSAIKDNLSVKTANNAI